MNNSDNASPNGDPLNKRIFKQFDRKTLERMAKRWCWDVPDVTQDYDISEIDDRRPDNFTHDYEELAQACNSYIHNDPSARNKNAQITATDVQQFCNQKRIPFTLDDEFKQYIPELSNIISGILGDI